MMVVNASTLATAGIFLYQNSYQLMSRYNLWILSMVDESDDIYFS
jgi:hypothetical protein